MWLFVRVMSCVWWRSWVFRCISHLVVSEQTIRSRQFRREILMPFYLIFSMYFIFWHWSKCSCILRIQIINKCVNFYGFKKLIHQMGYKKITHVIIFLTFISYFKFIFICNYFYIRHFFMTVDSMQMSCVYLCIYFYYDSFGFSFSFYFVVHEWCQLNTQLYYFTMSGLLSSQLKSILKLHFCFSSVF